MFHVEHYVNPTPRPASTQCYDAIQSSMPEFCDVALPVPLDTAFTYRLPDGMQPAIGGRVLVPFRQQRFGNASCGAQAFFPHSVAFRQVIENAKLGELFFGRLAGASG